MSNACTPDPQDADKAEPLDFHFRSVAESDDPDPLTQTNDQRLETLRTRIREALTALEKEDYRTFFSLYVDPFYLGRASAEEKLSVEVAFDQLILQRPESTQRMAADFKRVLSTTQTETPQWVLGGRAASFMKDRNNHTAQFWVYFDGKWRISPET